MAFYAIELSHELLLATDGKEAKLPTEFKLFGAGLTQTSKGPIIYSSRAASEISAAALKRGVDSVIDYEHASLSAQYAADPQKAGKAAGWFKVQCREDGCYAADVTWTPEGARSLSSREFRYFSPVLHVDPESGEVLAVFNAALTNNPATHGIQPLVASVGAENKTKEENPMKVLLHALTLSESAQEAEAVKVVEALKADKMMLLSATGKTSVSEALGVLAAWKMSSEKSAEYSAELEKMRGEVKRTTVEKLLSAAVEARKVTPAQVPFLTQLGLSDSVQLQAFLDASPAGIAVKGEPAQAGRKVSLSVGELKIAEQLGVSPEDFMASKAQASSPVFASRQARDAAEFEQEVQLEAGKA